MGVGKPVVIMETNYVEILKLRAKENPFFKSRVIGSIINKIVIAFSEIYFKGLLPEYEYEISKLEKEETTYITTRAIRIILHEEAEAQIQLLLQHNPILFPNRKNAVNKAIRLITNIEKYGIRKP